MKLTSKALWQSTLCCLALLTIMSSAPAAVTDLATAPLETSSPTLVKPNIFFVLDDSGSMDYDYMPDFVGGDPTELFNNSRYNTIYYNPATVYSPPVKYDGASFNAMNKGNTSTWSKVPNDAYNVQNTDSKNLVGVANYYVFTPAEYCTAIDLRSCVVQPAPSTTYPYTAYVRWCSDKNLTDCQATRVDTAPTGGKTYSRVRYPGQVITAAKSATSLVTLGGSGTTKVNGITVNGIQIMSIATGNVTTLSGLATSIAANINNCTAAITGACGIAGYSAVVTGNNGTNVTITAPASLGAIVFTPVVTKASGNMTFGTAKFAGGATGVSIPGQNVQTSIVSTVTSYPQSGTRTDCLSTTACTYEEEMTNYANWWAYYHTRMQMAKTAASLAFQPLTTSFRLGFMTINNQTGADFLNVADVATEAGGQKNQWYNKLVAASPGNATPLKKALSTAGRYYAGQLTKINGQTASDPMQYSCQRNYTLLSTDGYWNESTIPTDILNKEIGDTDGIAGITRPYLDGNATANTLADITQYFYTTDMRSAAFKNEKNPSGVDVSANATVAAQQRMLTYTIGLGVSGYMQYQPDYASATSGDYYDVLNGVTADGTRCRWQSSGACNWPVPQNNNLTGVDDLWHAAVNGRGTYYSAGDPVALRSGIKSFINNVESQNSAGAAVTPSTANVTSADKYLFDASFTSGQWFGELARYTIDADTGVTSTVPDWTESGTATTSSPTPSVPLLDRVPAASRAIYTYEPTVGTGLVSFDWGSLTTDMKKLFSVSAANLKSLSQMCAAGTECVPTAQQVDSTTAGAATGMGGINLVNFLRGDRSNEGDSGGKYYFKRTHVLGDIVGSQGAYVKRSTFNYPDTGYADFKTKNEARAGMVYVGANDGMLHAFSADDGSEKWAYIPSMLLPKLPKLADRNYGTNHNYFVNGSPQQGEVYLADKKWHTILVGGLAAGGRGYFALDVTDPTVAPKVLWEFTSDTSKASPYISDADLGYSYGIPIITKLSDGTWVVIVTSGYNNVSPGDGAGHLWVLNAQTGAIIKKMNTGVGSATAVVAGSGCTAAPCPSGLARISAWMDNVAINNTVSQVYSGDLYGNVWRFDLGTLKSDGSGTTSVQLMATLKDPSGNPQPVTSWIELGFASNSHIIYVGTGSYLGVTDIGSKQVQSIYAIKDTLTSASVYGNPRSNACSTTKTTACFMKQLFTDDPDTKVRTVSSSMALATNLGSMNGWFIDLPQTGERINTDSTLQLGMLVFVSNMPNNANPCGTGGSAYLNFIDYKTGLTIRSGDNTKAGVLLAGGSGLGSAAAVFSTKDGKLTASVKLSSGQRVEVPLPPGAGNVGTRRVSWRELISH
jgi:type IV pilus assembly protein PilY1